MFVEENMVEDMVIEEPENKIFIGVVVNCKKLNVRKEASLKSDSIFVLSEGNEVMVNEEESTHDFYKITTATGIEGFCMHDYIRIEP